MTGIELREIRQQLGLSQADLAARLEIWIEDLERLESEERVSRILELAMNWIEFEILKPADSELADTHRRVAEALESSERFIQS
jgi:transcriptional regulator with XRE-family HTH domain